MSKRNSRAKGIVDSDAAKPDELPDNGVADAGTGETIAAPASGAVDPASAVTEPYTEQPVRRGRGRPPGSGKSKATQVPLNVSGLEKLLVGIHGGLAILSGRMEWTLDTAPTPAFDGKSESEFLAHSIRDVAAHYGSGMFDQKTLDWMNLTQCLATVYISRIYVIRNSPRVRAAPPQGPQAVRPGPAPSVHRDHATPPPVNEFKPNGVDPAKANVGEIPGIGGVEFPPDHPLNPNQKRIVN